MPIPTVEPPEEIGDIEVWFEEIAKRGVRLDGDRLQPPGKAKSVRIRGGSRLVTDGPFAETKEVVAGYDVIDPAETEGNQAIEIAGLHPVASFGSVEVRPLLGLGGRVSTPAARGETATPPVSGTGDRARCRCCTPSHDSRRSTRS